ncbi:hypothetical protein L13192_08719 [Pyrenophora tritici-repentis]|nr:hypothetical protein L13192_12840 [Pyrenophora tritici-repentis]KAI1663272.1 hypothetical protein L13192_12679 [Pyrenophora tritici-repentis]KAI1663299.1 hypothetical protein L13192_12651 [Pyrenophora tritici-repentis]KAI1663862.1 hypothetical protein L13192_12259 [Pyrenophora tritici-repentis]KAI1668010.1 hypothetical protein L13192_08719 [Pyrenophora tritici-repentis]
MGALERRDENAASQRKKKRMKEKEAEKEKKEKKEKKKKKKKNKTSLGMLPDELLLAIGRNIPNVWDFARTNKKFFGIGADILVEQAKTSGSFSEACRAIRYMIGWTKPDYLINRFLTRLCTQVIENIKKSRFGDAESTLKVIKRLPSNTRIPKKLILDVAETSRDFIIQDLQAVNKSRFFDAKSTLEIIKLLPSDTRLPYNYFFDVVATGRLVIKQAIKSSQFDDAQWALKVIRRLPSNTRVRRKYFFNVIKTVKDITIQAIKDNKLDDAKSALDIIQQLTDISTMLSKNKKVDLLV